METETEKMEEASNHQLTVEIRLRKIQQATWSRKFIDLMTEYNRIQVKIKYSALRSVIHLACTGSKIGCL